MNLRANRPVRSRRGRLDRLDDSLGRTDIIRLLSYFPAAFGMDNHANSRMLPPDAVHVLQPEALVDRTIALPQTHPRVLDGLRRVSAQLLIGIPDDHPIHRDP